MPNSAAVPVPDPNFAEIAVPADPELARQRLRLWLQMLKSVRHLEGTLRERLRTGYDTTLPRFDVMAMLDRESDGLKMSDLSERLMVSNGNATGIVARLVEDGLVERGGMKNDRRASVVRLTPAGRELMSRLAADHLLWIDELMSMLPEADIARTISVMINLRED